MEASNIDTCELITTEQNEKRAIMLSPSGRKQILPPINTNDDRKMTKDCLPQNLLATLTQACAPFDDLGPKSKTKVKPPGRRTDNVWHHKKTREKLRHLTEQPPCHCGAGSDISYLLDAITDKPEKKNETNDDSKKQLVKTNLVPESIIPSEFYVVKHKGASGLEVHDEKYTTQAESHDNHQTVFPSMKPSGRQEALQLMQTMNKLLKKAGVSEKTESSDITGEGNTSQIENLLKLVKEEQTIYNIVFSEVIRQVSVECIERGTVLAELRKRYARLLESIPKQVKSLHEEVLAQRALDRRLTEELSNFKSAITLLTKELHEIHAHDEEVTKQAFETQAELNEALKESEKNASLLVEYHDLYELQRKRLDYQLSKLIEERDLWAGSAHMLSLKVTEKHNLVTIRRLHLYEKTWYKISNNFAVLLGHEDEKQLQILAAQVHEWQEITETFNERLFTAEKASSEKMQTIETSFTAWAKKFERVVTPDEGTVHPPEDEYIKALFTDMKSWEEVFNKECERFMGDVLLTCEDDLLQLHKCVDSWNQTAAKIFNNHPTNDLGNHPQHVQMMELNSKVNKLHNDFKLRMSGENGVSKIFIQIQNNLDTWINKVNAILNGGETLFDSEWLLIADLFQVQWKDAIQDVIKLLSCEDDIESDDAEERSEIVDNWLKDKSDVGEVYDATQKWLSETTSSIENEDSDIVEQVANTHSNMVRWTITILLRIAPDTKPVDPPNGVIEEDSSTGLGAAILEESTSDSIIHRATMLFNWLRCLTDRIVACTKGVVAQNKDPKLEEEEEDDANDELKEIESECAGWISTANLLVNEITGETIDIAEFVSSHIMLERVEKVKKAAAVLEDITNTSELIESKSIQYDKIVDEDNEPDIIENSEVIETIETIETPVTDVYSETIGSSEITETSRKVSDEEYLDMHVIGHDDNVKKRRISFTEDDPDRVNSSLDLLECARRSATRQDIQTMELLQKQLIETEIRAQGAEEKAFVAESTLKEAEEKIRSLEKALEKLITGEDETKGNSHEDNQNKEDVMSPVNVSQDKDDMLPTQKEKTESNDDDSDKVTSTEPANSDPTNEDDAPQDE